MSQKTALFEITLNGTTFTVEPGYTGLKIYRLYSDEGSYLIAKDYYGFWVELNRSPGSASIPHSLVGRKIDEHYGALCHSS